MVFDPNRPGDDLFGKRIYIQLELVHYLFSKETLGELMSRASVEGVPWTGRIRTNTVEVEVPASPSAPDCPPVRID